MKELAAFVKNPQNKVPLSRQDLSQLKNLTWLAGNLMINRQVPEIVIKQLKATMKGVRNA